MEPQTPIRLLMNDEDIRQFLLIAFDFKLERDAFLRPTREMVFNIYKKFVTALFCGDVDEPNLEAAPQMYDPVLLRLYLEFVPYMNLTLEIRRILRDWDNQMFHTSDILDPKRKRTQHFLSVLITVWGYIYDDVHPKWLAIAKEKSRLQLKDRKVNFEKTLVEARRTFQDVSSQILNHEASNGKDIDIDLQLCEDEDIAMKIKSKKEQARQKMSEFKLAHAKMRETKSDTKLATNKMIERRNNSKKVVADLNDRSQKYQNEVDIKTKLQNRGKVLTNILQLIDGCREWDETCLATHNDPQFPIISEVLSAISSNKDKKATIDFNRAQISGESLSLKKQSEDFESRVQTMTDGKDAIKSKVELALSEFGKTVNQAIDIVRGPLNLIVK